MTRPPLREILKQAQIALLNAPSLVEGEATYIKWFDGQRLAAIYAIRDALRDQP